MPLYAEVDRSQKTKAKPITQSNENTLNVDEGDRENMPTTAINHTGSKQGSADSDVHDYPQGKNVVNHSHGNSNHKTLIDKQSATDVVEDLEVAEKAELSKLATSQQSNAPKAKRTPVPQDCGSSENLDNVYGNMQTSNPVSKPIAVELLASYIQNARHGGTFDKEFRVNN